MTFSAVHNQATHDTKGEDDETSDGRETSGDSETNSNGTGTWEDEIKQESVDNPEHKQVISYKRLSTQQDNLG